jgi:O-antigen/teichoic acid export membrane protein
MIEDLPSPAPADPASPPGPERRRRRIQGQTFTLAGALAGASVLNFVFIVLVARVLEKNDLGVFFCAHSILLIAGAAGIAIQAFLARKYASGEEDDGSLFRRWALVLGAAGFASAILFALLSPAIRHFLRFPSLTPVLATAVALAAYAPLPLLYGRLQGKQKFLSLGAVYVVEAAVRPAVALLFLRAGALRATTAVASLASGYLVAVAFALLLSRPPRRVPGTRPDPRRVTGLVPTVVALLALASFAYMDVLFAQHYLGARADGPGSLLGGAGPYGAAAFVGRAFVMVTMPLVLVMYPKVAEAHARGEPAWPFLRDTLAMALSMWALGGTACVAFAEPITAAVYPNLPEAAPLVRFFPFAILPYLVLTLLAFHNLGRKRWRVVWVLFPGIPIQWASYATFHGSFIEILTVLGVTGGAMAAAAVVFTVLAELRDRHAAPALPGDSM